MFSRFSVNMELIVESQSVFISLLLLIFIGNVNAQGGGGVVIGLGSDYMLDTAFGELPNPLVTLPASNGQQPRGPTGTVGTTRSQAPTTNTAQPTQPTGGGLNVQGFSTLGSYINTLFPLDSSRIAGVANGQTIFLPGFLGSQLHSGSRVVLPAQSTTPAPVDTNQQYVLRNEDFTALGNVGHLVRVPVSNASSSLSSSSISATNNASSSDSSSILSSVAPDGTVTIDPQDIIGVADMNMLGPDGNPQFFSFNPGTGHASEISALQSAMQGTAVDMTDFLPPPFDPIDPFVDSQATSGTILNTSPTSETAVSSMNVVTMETSNPFSASSSNLSSSSTNTQGIDSGLTLSNMFNQNAMNINEESMLGSPNTQQNMMDFNEISMFDTGRLNTQFMQNTNEQSMFDTGSSTNSNNLNEQAFMNTKEKPTFDTGVTRSMASNEQLLSNTGNTARVNLSEQNMVDTLEQSMYDTSASGLSQQSLSNNPLSDISGSLTDQVNLKEQSTLNSSEVNSMNINEQSMFDTSAAFSGTEVIENSMLNTNKQSTDNRFSNINLNEGSMFNPGVSTSQNTSEWSMFDSEVMMGTSQNETSYFTSEKNSNNTNGQAILNKIHKSDIITSNEQINNNNNNNNRFPQSTKAPNMFTVGTIEVTKEQSNFGRTSIGGLFGVIDRQKDTLNMGLTGSRPNDINPNGISVSDIVGGNSYTIKSKGTNNNAGETSTVDTHVDFIQPGTKNTKTGNIFSESPAGQSSGTSTLESQNTILFQTTDTLSSKTNLDIPHVSDLTTEGLYPFEGSFTARDASLSQGSSAILDMSSVLQGHEPLHLEPPMEIVGEVITDSSAAKSPGNGTGIFAVVHDNNTAADITFDVAHEGTNVVKSTDTRSLKFDVSNPSDNVFVKPNIKTHGNEINKGEEGVSFLNSNENVNTLAIDKVNEYLGVDGTRSNNPSIGGKGIVVDITNMNKYMNENFQNPSLENISKLHNRRDNISEADSSILNASKLTSLNERRKGLLVAGNNNDINTFNTLDTSRNVVNNKITTITDGVDVAMSGFSGAPITNMVGVIPGKTSGGLVVSSINAPSFESTSISTPNKLNSSVKKEFKEITADKTGFPSGSFVIGAGQPNSKIISTGLEGLNSVNVGGVAIGSEQSSGLSSISLPASAFKTNERRNKDRQQTDTRNRVPAKVDMSHFVPPPYEILQESQTTHRVGSTAGLIKKALNRHNKNDRFNNRQMSPVDSTFTPGSHLAFDEFISSDQHISSGQRHGNKDINRELNFKDASVNSQLTQSKRFTNKGLLDSQTRFNDRIDTNQRAFMSNNKMNNPNVSNRESTNGRVRFADSMSTGSRTSIDQLSSIVKSNEHFGIVSGANISPRLSAPKERTAFPNSVGQQRALPSVVEDHAIFTDMARDMNAGHGASNVAAALDIHANQALDSFVGQPISEPIVGSIFGTTENSTSSLTQKFLEKSGITREPAVDFMTTFLQKAKPTRPPPEKNNVHIVPLSNFSPNSGNIITGRQNDAQAVDQFGVADIYTRQQQLNPSQWQQLMSKVSQDSKTVQGAIDLDYQTQNLVGASETKPLNGNMNAGSAFRMPTSAFTSDVTRKTLSENIKKSKMNSRVTPNGQNSVQSAVLFEAPGMTGHKSVTIRNYRPPSFNQTSRFNSFPGNVKSSSEMGQQNLQEFVGSQTTAERTTSFANTFRQNQQGRSPNASILPKNKGRPLNSFPLKSRGSADSQVQKEGQLAESGQQIQHEMETFKLGRSILVSDGVIPEFTGPNSVHSLPIDASVLQGLTANGMRLGQPAVSPDGSRANVQSVLSQSQSEGIAANEVTLQDIQRGAAGTIMDTNRQTMASDNRNLDSTLSSGQKNDISDGLSQSQQRNVGFLDNFRSLPQRQQNAGMMDNFGVSSQSQQSLDLGLSRDIPVNLPKTTQNIGIAIRSDLDRGLSITSETGSQQSLLNTANVKNEQIRANLTNNGQRSLDTATILGLNDALKKQPMEPTLFTSGSRFAVFGRAGDVNGRGVGNGHLAKPIPARRMGVLGPVHDCRYKPDPTSEYYFIYKNGITQHRFRCALGTAFDEMTCECSIRVSDHGDCLEVHMDFNNGLVEDSSLNRLPIGNENVDITNSSGPIAGIALFGGDGKLTIWRYQNYDFRDHVMLKVQFRPGVGGDRLQPLITNCDSSATEPSLGIIYDNMMNEVILLLKTVNDTLKELRFKVNPDEWNDVTYIYDGQEFIGIVNGVRRYVSRENPHLLGIIGGEIKSAPTHGLVEIRDAAIVLGHCPMYGHYRGAMVDIQIYTCIPKDFRLE